MGSKTRIRLSKKTMQYLALGIAIALVVAGGAWAAFGGRDDGDGADQEETTAQPDVATSSEASATPDSTLTAGTTTPTVTTEPEGGDSDPDTTSGAIEQHVGSVIGVASSGGSYTLSIDYVQFLNGDAAAQAAAAHGDPAPSSDLYILNDNPKVRDIPIAAGTNVRVCTNTDGTSNPTGYTMPLATWASSLKGAHGDAFKAGVYIVTLTSGQVTAIEQLYLP